ncbi:hypothetical protein SBRCBS47491_009419 [Sporothrix bragantina]|uniref:Uncharacterized protein n=1 Tax=Sporothrix bragantina TaxID=671064 RepID=A0ABP0CY12_9PEZI
MSLVAIPTQPLDKGQITRHRRPKIPSKQKRYYIELESVIFNVSRKYVCLASLGRAGQWILHQDDLYDPDIDTRPQSRSHDTSKEIPVRSLTVFGIPLPDHGLIWAGHPSHQTPSLQDIAFWKSKLVDLNNKIQQVQALNVHPHFSKDELQTLEALEQQPGHFFGIERVRRQKGLISDKIAVFNILFQLAKFGRPGQWILHNEMLYHPLIDTRPQSRRTEYVTVLHDAVFNGQTGYMVTAEPEAPLELFCDGNSSPPDLEDALYWEYLCKDLSDKLSAVERGQVQPHFTTSELQTIVTLESNSQHLFSIYARERGEHPRKFQVARTPEQHEAEKQLWMAKDRVVTEMETLWESGLAGKWVLHHQEIYLTAYDTHCRDNDADEDDANLFNVLANDNTIVQGKDIASNGPLFEDSGFGHMYWDSHFQPRPDFDDISYWEKKRAHLKALARDIVSGRLMTHNFSKSELMRISMLERTLEYKTAAMFMDEDDGEQGHVGGAANQVSSWLSEVHDSSAYETRLSM